MLFWPILGHFWCLVVNLVTFSSDLSDFEKNPYNHKISPHLQKNQKKKKSKKFKKRTKKKKLKKIHNENNKKPKN